MKQVQKQIQHKKKEATPVGNEEAAKRTDEQDELLEVSDALLDEIDELLEEEDPEPERFTFAHVEWLIRRMRKNSDVDLPCGCF